ncbi:MAG: DUF427 domain-containing protein [Pseudomonadota bacterium]
MQAQGGKNLAANPAPGFKLRPDHKVKCDLYRGDVIVSLEGTEIARSASAVLVTESDHRPILYMPQSDVHDEFLIESRHVTRCPFKGKARYWNVKIEDHEVDNAVWAYEMPYDEVLELAGLMAFYETKLDIEVIPAN